MAWLDEGADYPPPGRTRLSFDAARGLLVEHPRFTRSTTRPELWERLLDSRREQLDAWRAEQDRQPIPTADELDDADRRNHLDSVRAYDPEATLLEELTAQLVGELPDGALPADLGSALLAPLDKTVAEAGGGNNVHLELVGISRGSTVLHFRPVVPSIDADTAPNSQLAVDLPLARDPAGAAISQVLHLIDATERHEDVARWSNALAPLSKVVDALEAYDATLKLTWHAADGRISRSSLSATGRRYLRRLREEAHVHATRRTLSGTIVELKAAETTFVRIKLSPAHFARSYEIRFENRQDLVDLHLELDAQVAIVVEEIETTDGTGHRRGVTYRFSRMAGGSGETSTEVVSP